MGSVVFIATIVGARALDSYKHVVLVGGHQDLLVFSFDAQERQIVCGVYVPDHTLCFLGQK